jgi:hypothetical protein
MAPALLVIGMLLALGAYPAAAQDAPAGSEVKGSACGYYANMGFFTGPQSLMGCGQPENAPGNAASPSVTLPDGGSNQPVMADDADGAAAVFGPATVFGGIWPVDVVTAPQSGPISVSTKGTSKQGTVASSADIWMNKGPDATSPGGFGPQPVQGEELHADCRTSKKSSTGSATFKNATLTTSTNLDGSPRDIEPIPDEPPVNYTRSGVVNNVGDAFTVVLNEHIPNADGSLTVNAAHIYWFGPVAVGEVVMGQVSCGGLSSVESEDTESPRCGPVVVEPVSVSDPAPKVPLTELVGVFDTGGVEEIRNIETTNATVQVGVPDDEPYLEFQPGQSGPVQVRATRVDESQPMSWSFEAVDQAGNARTSTDCPSDSPLPAVDTGPIASAMAAPFAKIADAAADEPATDSFATRGSMALLATPGVEQMLANPVGAANPSAFAAAAAQVSGVRGSACGYYVNVGLFGGPQDLRGCGQPAGAPPSATSPDVSLPGGGSPTPITAEDPDGAVAQYGPARIFAGRWPCVVPAGNCPLSAPQSGPMSVSTEGTPDGGTVKSSANIVLFPPPGPVVGCSTTDTTATTCNAPGGFGPWPVEGDEMHVECSASETQTTGSVTMKGSQLAVATDAIGEPTETESVPDTPPINYTRSGVITNVGDVFSVVYNEQIINDDGSLTVNGVHMYLFGPTAAGEMVKGQAVCGTTPSPLTPEDTQGPRCGTLVVAPVSPEDPTPRTPRTELIGVWDPYGLQEIRNIQSQNATVHVGVEGGAPYLAFQPGQTGPLQVTATRNDEAQPMTWSFEAVDEAGNVTNSSDCPTNSELIGDVTDNPGGDGGDGGGDGTGGTGGTGTGGTGTGGTGSGTNPARTGFETSRWSQIALMLIATGWITTASAGRRRTGRAGYPQCIASRTR